VNSEEGIVNGMAGNELKSLEEGIKICRKCPLHRSRTNAVPGQGAANARIFLLGEAPGKMEDAEGMPFIGKSGRYLDAMLENIGLSRDEVYITSSVKCRPPKNRKPVPNELAICKASWLDKQLAIIKPKLVILLGRTALYQMTGRVNSLLNCHGEIFCEREIDCFITFHPASAMRFGRIAKAMQEDLAKLKTIIPRYRCEERV